MVFIQASRLSHQNLGIEFAPANRLETQFPSGVTAPMRPRSRPLKDSPRKEALRCFSPAPYPRQGSTRRFYDSLGLNERLLHDSYGSSCLGGLANPIFLIPEQRRDDLKCFQLFAHSREVALFLDENFVYSFHSDSEATNLTASWMCE